MYIDTLQHRSVGKDGIPIDFPVANITVINFDWFNYV